MPHHHHHVNMPHHHHHHFLNVFLFHAKLGLDVCPIYEVPPHNSEQLPIQVATQATSCHLSHTLPLILPAHTSHPSHHHICTDRHPIIHTFTLRMSKPPQSATPHPEDCTNPHCTFCPSTTLHTSISPYNANFIGTQCARYNANIAGRHCTAYMANFKKA